MTMTESDDSRDIPKHRRTWHAAKAVYLLSLQALKGVLKGSPGPIPATHGPMSCLFSAHRWIEPRPPRPDWLMRPILLRGGVAGRSPTVCRPMTVVCRCRLSRVGCCTKHPWGHSCLCCQHCQQLPLWFLHKRAGTPEPPNEP